MSADASQSAGKPADNPFGLTPGAWAGAGRPLTTWRLPLINGVAAAAIIGAVGFRLWEAHLPQYAVQEELVLIGAGVVFAVLAIAVRASRSSVTLSRIIRLRRFAWFEWCAEARHHLLHPVVPRVTCVTEGP